MSKAVWFTAPRTVELRDDPVRDPGPAQITVRAHYSLISPGSELRIYRGEGNLPDEFVPMMEGTFDFPVKFAYQTVGDVVAVGEGAEFRVGDLVFCAHPHQELFTLDVTLVEPLPEGVELKRAVFGSLFRVALNCYLDAPVRVGEFVVVSGLGLVGSFSAYLARKAALRLVVVDTNEDRRRRADWIGADAVVGPQDAAEAIAELTGGAGVDMWIETSGSGPALQLAIDHVAQDGLIAVPAWYGSNEVSLRLSPEFHLRRLRIVSSWAGRVGSGQQARWDRSRLLKVALYELERVDLGRIITHEIPFTDAELAYRLIDEGVEDTLGVVLVHDHT